MVAPPTAAPPQRPAPNTHSPATSGWTNLLGGLRKAGLTLGEGSAVSLLLYLIVVAFLAVQDRIDRSDPKLALAPVYGEPHLSFVPYAHGEGL